MLGGRELSWQHTQLIQSEETGRSVLGGRELSWQHTQLIQSEETGRSGCYFVVFISLIPYYVGPIAVSPV
jgi:uncharacterized protein (DUF779 family)